MIYAHHVFFHIFNGWLQRIVLNFCIKIEGASQKIPGGVCHRELKLAWYFALQFCNDGRLATGCAGVRFIDGVGFYLMFGRKGVGIIQKFFQQLLAVVNALEGNVNVCLDLRVLYLNPESLAEWRYIPY